MKMEVKFNMVYNVGAIEKKTGESIEVFKKWIDENMHEELEELLKYELEDEGFVAIENINIKY